MNLITAGSVSMAQAILKPKSITMTLSAKRRISLAPASVVVVLGRA